MTSKTERVTGKVLPGIDDVGCWSDADAHGQRDADEAIIKLAQEWGYGRDPDRAILISTSYAHNGKVLGEVWGDAAQAAGAEHASEIIDEAIEFLNDRVAIDGFLFGLDRGSLYYQPLSWWCPPVAGLTESQLANLNENHPDNR